MTNLDKYLAEVKARAEMATPGPFMGRSEEWGTDLLWTIYKGRPGESGFSGKQAIAAFWDHDDASKFIYLYSDITRLVAMVEMLRKQRDGYRENYWALVKPCIEDRRQIIEDNAAELDGIAGE